MSRMHPSHDLNSALDLVSDRVLARLDGPPEKVRGLPNETFTSQAFFELEQQTLFTRCWSFAGIASELPEVGDVRPVEVAGQPLLLIRGADGEIRVFQNVCPHRGAKLLDEPANLAKGITCVYHAWSYGLDGQLRARPHFNGPSRHDSGCRRRCRRRLPVPGAQSCLVRLGLRQPRWQSAYLRELSRRGDRAL